VTLEQRAVTLKAKCARRHHVVAPRRLRTGCMPYVDGCMLCVDGWVPRSGARRGLELVVTRKTARRLLDCCSIRA